MAGNGGGGSNVAMVVTGNKYIHVCLYTYPIYIHIRKIPKVYIQVLGIGWTFEIPVEWRVTCHHQGFCDQCYFTVGFMGRYNNI